MIARALVIVALVMPTLVAPAFAHHSYSMFNRETMITLSGTLNEYEWTNPHGWPRLMVVNPATRKPEHGAFAMSSPARQIKLGMARDSLKPKDRITVTFHPMKDGTRGGQFI